MTKDNSIKRLTEDHDSIALAKQLIAVGKALNEDMSYDDEDFDYVNRLIRVARCHRQNSVKLITLKNALGEVFG